MPPKKQPGKDHESDAAANGDPPDRLIGFGQLPLGLITGGDGQQPHGKASAGPGKQDARSQSGHDCDREVPDVSSGYQFRWRQVGALGLSRWRLHPDGPPPEHRNEPEHHQQPACDDHAHRAIVP